MTFKNKVKIGIILFLLLLLYFILNKYLNFSIPCIFHEITDLYCPGCGITRMFFSLIELDFYHAFRSNPLVFVLLCLYLIYLIFKVVLPKDLKIPNSIYYVLLVIVILFGILRNISIFDFLAPN